jgi:hypothetical protein
MFIDTSNNGPASLEAVKNGCSIEWNPRYKAWCCGCKDDLHNGDQQCSIITVESSKRRRSKKR